MPPEEERRGPGQDRPDGNTTTAASVAEERPRCAAVTLAGKPCQAWPASSGTPWCSMHRWLHRHEDALAAAAAAGVDEPDALVLSAWAAGYTAGYERGYELRGDEVNGEYPPPPVLAFGKWYSQAEERQRADAEVRQLVAEERGR